MVEVTRQMEERIARIEERLTGMAEDVKDTQQLVRKALYGNNGHVGMTVRLDRLEQWKGSASKMLWALVGGAVTVAASLAVWLVKG